MQALLPTRAKGTHVFRAATSTATSGQLSSSSDTSGDNETRSADQGNTVDAGEAIEESGVEVDDGDLTSIAEPPPQTSPPASSPPATVTDNEKYGTKRSAEKRKFPASVTSTELSSVTGSGSSGKRSRITGPVALTGIKEELASLNTTIRRAAETSIKATEVRMANSHSDSDKRSEARDLLQDNETELPDEALLAIIDVFEADVHKAETYVGLRRNSLRRLWIRRELAKMNYVLNASDGG